MLISTGHPSPLPLPPGPDGGTMFLVLGGVLIASVALPDVTDAERAAFEADIIGYGLYSGALYPSGILSVILSRSDGAWPLASPIAFGTSDERHGWCQSITHPDVNTFQLILVEQRTGIVQRIRVHGMPQTLRESLAAISSADDYSFSASSFTHCLAELGQAGLWSQSLRWLADASSGEVRGPLPQLGA
jgi:hypothetical protein